MRLDRQIWSGWSQTELKLRVVGMEPSTMTFDYTKPKGKGKKRTSVEEETGEDDY